MQHRINEPLSISIYNKNIKSERTSLGIGGEFVQIQLLLCCLRRMTPNENDNNTFILFYSNEYKDNKSYLKIIKEFEENYTVDQAIHWYTKDTFIYRELNKSLRTQNIDFLFIFRFFIRDIEAKLRESPCSKLMTLYRGQLMCDQELNNLKQSKGQFNIFFYDNKGITTFRCKKFASMCLFF